MTPQLLHPRAAIDAALAEGLHAAADARLRVHLRRCDDCRTFYDERAELIALLGGRPGGSTRIASEALIARTLRQLGAKPVAKPLPQPGPWARLREAWLVRPWLAPAWATLAALALLVVLVSGPRAGPHTVAPPKLEASRNPVAAPPVPRVEIAEAPSPVGQVVKARDLKIDQVDAANGTPAAAVLADQLVTTGAHGGGDIALARGGRVHVYPSARLKIAVQGDAVELQLGRASFQVDHTGVPFSVRTPFGEVAVVGTSFVVDVKQAWAEIRVLNGAVDVTDTGRLGHVHVKAGERTRLAAAAAPEAVQRFDVGPERNELNDLINGMNRGLDRAFGGH